MTLPAITHKGMRESKRVCGSPVSGTDLEERRKIRGERSGLEGLRGAVGALPKCSVLFMGN